MNMKKTLAGLMAGVVAISAMATVAVSAKAQEAKTKTWTTSWTEKEKSVEKTSIVQVVITAAKATEETEETTLVWGDPVSSNQALTDITAPVPTEDPADENDEVVYEYDTDKWVDEAGDEVTITVTGQPNDGDTITFSAEEEVTVIEATDGNYAWAIGDKLTLKPSAVGETKGLTATNFKIKKVLRVENRATGSSEIITDNLGLFVTDTTPDTQSIEFAGPVSNTKGAPLAVILEVEADVAIPVGAFDATLVSSVDATLEDNAVSNTQIEAEDKVVDKGILINKEKVGNGVEEKGELAYVEDLDVAINKQAALAKPDPDNAKSKKIVENLEVSEATEEMMDYMLDAKGAEITFTFLKKDYKVDEDYTTFDQWYSRYDWDSTSMKSAISLRVNGSNVLSVSMKDFDKENFAATFSWDDVMAKFQGGSYTGLVRDLGFKVDNSKLPTDKDGKTIDLEIASITVKVPEMKETEDDTMVEDIVKDFAAGESATVVEDTLPAASDAPAATDAPSAPATTDAAANPETGNSAAALLAIPAALAAAAIVAKKRG